MAQYKLLQKWFGAESGTSATSSGLWNVGEIINMDLDFPAPEFMEPYGSGPHNQAPRKFDIPGYEDLPLHKRAESWSAQASTGNFRR